MKSGIVGFGIIASLIVVAGVVPFYAPYDVVRHWSSFEPWQDNPKRAAPEWSDPSGIHEPRTMIFESDSFRKVVVRKYIPPSQGGPLNLTIINLTKNFYWNYDEFPSEISIAVNASFPGQSPAISVYMWRPDNQYVLLLPYSATDEQRNVSTIITQKSEYIEPLKRNLRTWVLREGVLNESNVPNWQSITPETVLFARNDSAQVSSRNANIAKGFYQLVIDYEGFSLSDDVNGRFIVYGTVFGLAGTDDHRRDLLTGLLWGAPIALAFGVAAGGVVVLIQTLLGALAAWYGGPIDEFVQRAADFYLVIPTLPILILVSLFYRPGIVALLFYLVAFGVVGSTTKVVRSIVLQIKEEQFIEAAQSYGASRGRILFKYIIPRIMPYTFALVALSVPAFIFVEASLSFLGLGDPVLPTWGAIIGEAYTQGALFYGWWWWILFPAGGIIYTTIGFALLGYAFDKVLNPRLREE
ncbi:MAG TPA: ABC transporter permease [Thermoplasmata archaeon]